MFSDRITCLMLLLASCSMTAKSDIALCAAFSGCEIIVVRVSS